MNKLKKPLFFGLIALAISVSISFKSDFFEIAKQIEIYTTLFKELNLYYVDEINPAEVMDNSIKHTLENLDPYTRFYDEQGVIEARITAEGEYGGIGATIIYKDKNLLIKEVFENYPAHKSGIIAGDKIIEIDQVSLKDIEQDMALGMLKGVPNSDIEVKIIRQGKYLNFKLKREKVEINPVPYYAMVNDNVGYIAFTRFNKKASDEVKNAYEDLVTQGMEKLIIDVRHNPGGLLNEAVEIVNFFVPKNNIVVTTKAKLDKWSLDYKTKNEPLNTELPIAILIDDRSASASEILAGALQDYDRAIVVGQRSFGKGLVQRSRELSYGTQLKLTISKYYTPSGRCIQELDYTNRVGDSIPKFSDGKINEFKTQNGRLVYDGGGIEPDIKIDRVKNSNIVEALYNSDGYFQFTTNYYFENPEINQASEFELDNKVYEDLKAYLTENPKAFKTQDETVFQESFKKLEVDKNDLKKDFETIMSQLYQEKINSLDKHKQEIEEHLTSSIINRYYFKTGEYKNRISKDKTILEAAAILGDELQYATTLNK